MHSFITKTIFFAFFISALCSFSFAQQGPTKDELQKQQKDLQREIDNLNATLKSITKNKKRSLGEVIAIQRKIEKREQLINSINKEVHRIDDDIFYKEREQYRLKKELDTLKQKYAQSIVFAYKNSSSYEYLNFLFSAKDFNDALKRMQYLKSYREYRETQAQAITKTQTLLQHGIVDLNNTKNEKSKVLENQNSQLHVLEVDKKEKDQIVKGLKDQEKDIQAQIRKRERKQQELRNAIAAAIRREMEDAKRKERERLAKLKEAEKNKPTENNSTNNNPVVKNNSKPTSATTGVKATATSRVYSELEGTPEGKEMSINFENNKHNLPWPISGNHPITHEFGTQIVPGTHIRESNIGISIGVPVGTNVKCVANGEVANIMDMSDGSMAVVVQHGKYFTTYSNLSAVNVNKGNKVSAGTSLGKAASNLEGEGEITFIVSNEKSQFLDPRSWLKSK